MEIGSLTGGTCIPAIGQRPIKPVLCTLWSLSFSTLRLSVQTIMASASRAITVALWGLSLLSPVLAFSPTFPYGSEKVRGVNLGGWLVLEVRRLAIVENFCANDSTNSLGLHHHCSRILVLQQHVNSFASPR